MMPGYRIFSPEIFILSMLLLLFCAHSAGNRVVLFLCAVTFIGFLFLNVSFNAEISSRRRHMERVFQKLGTSDENVVWSEFFAGNKAFAKIE